MSYPEYLTDSTTSTQDDDLKKDLLCKLMAGKLTIIVVVLLNKLNPTISMKILKRKKL